MDINDLAEKAYLSVMRRGFFSGPLPIEAVRLVVLQQALWNMAEAAEIAAHLAKYGATNKAGLIDEIADNVVTILVLARLVGVENIASLVLRKLALDESRGWRHQGGEIPLKEALATVREVASRGGESEQDS